MVRIVIDARELRTSSGRYVERLLHYLQATDQNNEYRILLKPADFEGWQPTSLNFTKVLCPHKEFTFDEQFGLKNQLESLDADLVHFTFAQQPIWYNGKTVTTFHDLTTLRFRNPDKNRLVFKLKQWVYRYVVIKSAQKAAFLIAISEFVRQDLIDFTGVSPEKVCLTYEAADKITAAAELMPALQTKPFLLYVGRPMSHKNLDRLVEAFVLLSKSMPDLHLVLAGKLDNNYRRIQAAVERNSVKNVVFTDFVSEGQLRWLYENCRAYVFPSLSEGFGLPGLEAMAHGAPVVSSNATCLPEVYGAAAHYFDPLSVESIAKAIQEVLSDEDLRRVLILEGQKQVDKYSWQRLAEQTLAVYQKALSKN